MFYTHCFWGILLTLKAHFRSNHLNPLHQNPGPDSAQQGDIKIEWLVACIMHVHSHYVCHVIHLLNY